MGKTSVQTRPKTKTAKCWCNWSEYADHDRLLNIEGDYAALAALIKRTVEWGQFGDEPEDQAVEPHDLVDFAAEHNWNSPGAVVDLFRDLVDLRRLAAKADMHDRECAHDSRGAAGMAETADARLDALEQAINAMQAEVRTRRLVVVDEHGFERIVGSTLDGDGSASLRVSSRPHGDACVTSVALVASNTDEASWADLAVSRGGVVQATLGIHEVADDTHDSFVELELMNSDLDVARVIRVGSDVLHNLPYVDYRPGDQ